jgi:hypothetical protein
VKQPATHLLVEFINGFINNNWFSTLKWEDGFERMAKEMLGLLPAVFASVEDCVPLNVAQAQMQDYLAAMIGHLLQQPRLINKPPKDLVLIDRNMRIETVVSNVCV